MQLFGNAAFSAAQTAPGAGGSHSLQVDGADDFAYVDNANGANELRQALGGSFTVSMWGRSDVPSSSVTSNGLAYLFDVGSSHGTGTGVFFNQSHGVSANNQIGAYYNNNTGISSGIQGLADTWYHVALTGDGSTVRLYVDGTPVGSRSQAGTISTSQQFRIGSEAKANQREWRGYLDDVAVFSEKLSDSQIAALAGGTSPADTAAQTRVLMLVNGVSNGQPTAADDQVVYDRLTSVHGYDVTVIDDGASTTGDANGHDLVVVSGSVGSGNIGNKFNYIGIPVLNYEPSNWDDFKLSAGGDGGAATDLDVLLPDHPLAAGLPAGANTVVTASSQFSGGDAATLGSGAKVVANIVGLNRPGIVEYATGSMLSDQGSGPALPAPAERIGFFFRGVDGGTGAQSNLNADGWALFDAAVEHAMADDQTLRVDFGTGTQQVLPGFLPFQRGTGDSVNTSGNSETESYAISLGVGGTVDVTVATSTTLGFRDRGDGNQGALGDLYEDHVKPNSASNGTAEALDLIFDDLRPGVYRLTTFHHDLGFDAGDLDVMLSDAGGTRQVAADLSQTTGNPGDLAFLSLLFGANGVDPVTITFQEIAGTANNPEAALNGFILTQQVPEPGSFVLLAIGAAGLLWCVRRRRK